MKNTYKSFIIFVAGWIIGVSLIKLVYYVTGGAFDTRGWLFSIMGGVMAIGIIFVSYLLYELRQKKYK